jgi:hypothetical protein
MHPAPPNQVPVSNYSLRVSIHYMLFGETTASEIKHIAETVVPVVGALVVALFVTDVSMVRVSLGTILIDASHACPLCPQPPSVQDSPAPCLVCGAGFFCPMPC